MSTASGKIGTMGSSTSSHPDGTERNELNALPRPFETGGTDGAAAALGRLTSGSDEARQELGQIRSRQRVRDLAEVYTHQREVDAMLDLVANRFPSPTEPGNTDCTFFEPACGHGNFLEEILRRKLTFVTARRYGNGERLEHRILRCLASIYAIDISGDNVAEARSRLRALVAAHRGDGSEPASAGFVSAVDVVLETNIVQADALADVSTITLVEYRPGPAATFLREWSFLDAEQNVPSLFSPEPRRDEAPVHFSLLRANPEPVTVPEALEGAA
jgi:hypothetical protein